LLLYNVIIGERKKNLTEREACKERKKLYRQVQVPEGVFPCVYEFTRNDDRFKVIDKFDRRIFSAYDCLRYKHSRSDKIYVGGGGFPAYNLKTMFVCVRKVEPTSRVKKKYLFFSRTSLRNSTKFVVNKKVYYGYHYVKKKLNSQDEQFVYSSIFAASDKSVNKVMFFCSYLGLTVEVAEGEAGLSLFLFTGENKLLKKLYKYCYTHLGIWTLDRNFYNFKYRPNYQLNFI